MKPLLSEAGPGASRIAGVLIAALCASWLTQSARAATAAPPAGDAYGLDEIVVTAEKRNSTIQNTAISMSAISGDVLLAKGISSVEDIAGQVPGVSMRTAGPGQT